jgi:hypothetical protein
MSNEKSIVTIFFDSVPTFIEKIKQEFDMTHLKWDYMSSDKNSLIYQLGIQTELRELFEANKHLLRFNYKTDTLGLPNMFALMIALYSDLSICNSWEELMEQTRNSHFIGFTNDGYEDENTRESGKCCCGKSCNLTNQYLVTNTLTNKTLLLGCSCIEKKLLINIDDEKKQRKQDIKNREKAKQAAKEYALQKAEFEAKQALELAAKLLADQEAEKVAKKEAKLLAELKHDELINKPLVFQVFYKHHPERFIWLNTKWTCTL